MADNYLERKMQDLKSGKLQNSILTGKISSSKAGKLKGMLQIPFPIRRVLVTGGCHGIGLAITLAFCKAGCKVAVFDCDKEAGEALATNHGIRFYHLDVADHNAIENALDNLFKSWLDIDIIVSNAGIADFKPISECSIADFNHVVNVNLTPAFIMARKWVLHRKNLPLKNTFGGRLILISSTRHMQSEVSTEAYSASKGALISLTHTLMMSLQDFHITVNSISPGWINTNNEILSETDNSQHPSGRVGKPEDIARLCLFLCAPDNDFINGIDIPVDGGMTHKMQYQ